MHSVLLTMARDAVAVSQFHDSFYHGEDHWRGVADQALWLAESLSWGRTERVFLYAFGAAHDCRRENDDRDPEHGQRAADWLVQERWAHRLGIPHLEGLLYDSLVRHDQGFTTTTSLTGACWDADRSLLERVGIVPNPRYFSTVPAHLFAAMVARGGDVAYEPATWDDLAQRALA